MLLAAFHLQDPPLPIIGLRVSGKCISILCTPKVCIWDTLCPVEVLSCRFQTLAGVVLGETISTNTYLYYPLWNTLERRPPLRHRNTTSESAAIPSQNCDQRRYQGSGPLTAPALYNMIICTPCTSSAERGSSVLQGLAPPAAVTASVGIDR